MTVLTCLSPDLCKALPLTVPFCPEWWWSNKRPRCGQFGARGGCCWQPRQMVPSGTAGARHQAGTAGSGGVQEYLSGLPGQRVHPRGSAVCAAIPAFENRRARTSVQPSGSSPTVRLAVQSGNGCVENSTLPGLIRGAVSDRSLVLREDVGSAPQRRRSSWVAVQRRASPCVKSVCVLQACSTTCSSCLAGGCSSTYGALRAGAFTLG
jgi:hypothetical protein